MEIKIVKFRLIYNNDETCNERKILMILRIWKQDVKKLLASYTTWISFIIYLIIAFANILLVYSEQPTANPMYESMSSFDYFVSVQGGGSGFLFIFLPLAITLATGDFFIKERRSSMLSYSLVRTGSKQYIWTKITVFGTLSFLFVFVIQAILLIVTMTFFPFKLPALDQGIVFYAAPLFLNQPFLYCLLIILNQSLMAFFYSCLSIFFSILFKNLYVAVMLPYVFFIGISQFLQAMPMFSDELGLLLYNMSPLTMTGDFITKSFNWSIVPLYWVVLILVMIPLISYIFNKKFTKETLILR